MEALAHFFGGGPNPSKLGGAVVPLTNGRLVILVKGPFDKSWSEQSVHFSS